MKKAVVKSQRLGSRQPHFKDVAKEREHRRAYPRSGLARAETCLRAVLPACLLWTKATRGSRRKLGEGGIEMRRFAMAFRVLGEQVAGAEVKERQT